MKLLKWSFRVRIGVWKQRCNYLALTCTGEFTLQSMLFLNSTLCTIWPQHTPQRRPRTMQPAVSPVCLLRCCFSTSSPVCVYQRTAPTAIQTAIHLAITASQTEKIGLAYHLCSLMIRLFSLISPILILL